VGVEDFPQDRAPRSVTTAKCERKARAFSELDQGDLLPLDQALPELAKLLETTPHLARPNGPNLGQSGIKALAEPSNNLLVSDSWRNGRVVEGSGFENRRSRKATKGSNPFSSAKFFVACGCMKLALERQPIR
jgi:hypothetical protein